MGYRYSPDWLSLHDLILFRPGRYVDCESWFRTLEDIQALPEAV